MSGVNKATPSVTNGEASTASATNGKAPTPSATNGKAPTPSVTNGKAPIPSATNGKAPTTSGSNGKAPPSSGGNSKAPTPSATNVKAPTNGGPSASTNKAAIPPQATGPPSYPLSPAEDYFTKLLIRPEVLESIASNLHSNDFRSLQQTSKAMARVIDYTCGSPAANFLSKYTCGGSNSSSPGGAKTCWGCGIKVCDGCALKISSPINYNTSHPLSYMELNSQKKEAVCADCYLQPWGLLMQERRKRLGEGEKAEGPATEVPKKK